MPVVVAGRTELPVVVARPAAAAAVVAEAVAFDAASPGHPLDL